MHKHNERMKLFYIMLGATPVGRTIEQYDVFFGIAETLKDLVPDIKEFWKEADGTIHIGCWQEINFVAGFELKITKKKDFNSEYQLYFINLGGYKEGFAEEFHEQHLLMAGTSVGEIIEKAKSTECYKIMGIDYNNIFSVNDILPKKMKEKYSIVLKESNIENKENPTGLECVNIDEL